MMAIDEEFEAIVSAIPELGNLDRAAPEGFMLLHGADGTEARISRAAFIEHTNAILDALKDMGADLAAVVAPVAALDPLARRVVLGTAFQAFKDWMLDRCELVEVPFAVFHLPAFVAVYRTMTEDAPAYAGEFTYEGASNG